MVKIEEDQLNNIRIYNNLVKKEDKINPLIDSYLKFSSLNKNYIKIKKINLDSFLENLSNNSNYPKYLEFNGDNINVFSL